MKDKMFVITTIVIIFSFLAGCSDSDNIVSISKRINVSGKVIGHFFNLGLRNVKIRIEDKYTVTDNYGKFFISDVQVPYSVYVTDTVTNSSSVFEGLSASDCWLPHFRYEGLNLPESGIYITFSGVTGNSNAWKAFFTDGKNVNGMGEPLNFSVYLPDNQPVTGKVCVLLYTKDNNGAVISYDKFGYKDNITILPNDNINLVFTDSMLSYNPPEALITGTIIGLPPHSSTEFSQFWISMSPRKSDNYYTLSNIFSIHGNTFSFYIPSNLPVDYFPVLQVNVSDSSSIGEFVCRLNYLLPNTGGTGLNIGVPTTPLIISPPPLSLVDTNTVFSYQDNFGSEIYHVIFSDSVKTFHIYTNKQSTGLWLLGKSGIGQFAPNSKIFLSVNTIGKFNNVDEYVNPEFKNIGLYTSNKIIQSYIMKP